MYRKLKCVCPRVSVSQLKILGFWIKLFSGNGYKIDVNENEEHAVPPKTQQDMTKMNTTKSRNIDAYIMNEKNNHVM